MIDVFHGVFRHCVSMSIASIFQKIKLIAELVLRILTSWIAENSTGTASNVGLSARINIVPGGRLQRIRCVRRIDIDAIRAVVSTKLWVYG